MARIADVFSIQQKFVRSIHLERDFLDSSALAGYCISPQILSYIHRILACLAPTSGQRSWRITGDYGTGKSAFALALAHLLSGNIQGLPSPFQQFKKVQHLSTHKGLLPLLVTGSREPLACALLRALSDLLRRQGSTLPDAQKFVRKLERRIGQAGNQPITDSEVIDALDEVSELLSTRRYRGIFLVLDELGKFLEFAAMHPERQDIYLLQRLAEHAARSGSMPFVIVGILHQGFTAYADRLSQNIQREWEKVAGRYEEILFSQPLTYMAGLVSQAMNVNQKRLPKSVISHAKADMEAILASGWYGAERSQDLNRRASELYPLHPSVLPVMVSFFSRFGQNERSLFSFILSDEPFALKAFAEGSLESEAFYRIHNFYDYINSTFGHRLSIQSHRSHWSLVSSIIEKYTPEHPIELTILKTVAVLSLLDINANKNELSVCIDSAKASAIARSILRLQGEKHVLYHRGQAGGFCLWPNTSVNLDATYEDATKALGTDIHIADLIEDHLETRPLVARRHYIETGNLRHFQVQYVSLSELETADSADFATADGRILIPMCETSEERALALKIARSERFAKSQDVLIGVPNPLSSLAEDVLDFRRWQWIIQNVHALNHDSYAAEQASRQLAAAHTRLQQRLEEFLGLRQLFGSMQLAWYHCSQKVEITNGRQFLQYLSTVCDQLYPHAPRVLNELVNRRTLSSAAAAARMRLIEAMLKDADKPLLGMDGDKKPPEMSMYLSVLRAGQLHRQDVGGRWSITAPKAGDDPSNLAPVMEYILAVLGSQPDQRIKISDLNALLRRPPYGVRDGLALVLLAAVTHIHEHELAYYEDGTFQRHIIGEDFQRIVKAPDKFELQLCRVIGIRSVLFERLLAILGFGMPAKRSGELLDIVRPLCNFAAQLPSYSHRTHLVSELTKGVRKCLLSSQDPVKLLFSELPAACGFEPFSPEGNQNSAREIEDYVVRLKGALDELRDAYPNLLEKLKIETISAFDLPPPITTLRERLSRTAKSMLGAITEPQLKALCLRMSDDSLAEQAWIEALGSLVCAKPPAKWLDTDLHKFTEELSRLVARFRRVESIVFARRREAGERAQPQLAVRISVTRADGAEMDQVVQLSKQEEKQMKQLEHQIRALLKEHGRVGLAAASLAVWDLLEGARGAAP